jgi:hypothetical protein
MREVAVKEDGLSYILNRPDEISNQIKSIRQSYNDLTFRRTSRLKFNIQYDFENSDNNDFLKNILEHTTKLDIEVLCISNQNDLFNQRRIEIETAGGSDEKSLLLVALIKR